MSKQPETGYVVDNTHILPIRVYYEDTDFSGVVYHAAYLKFLERGRTESFRFTGTSHLDLLAEEVPLAFALRNMEISFIAPARIDDVLQVHTRLLDAKGARMNAEQSVFCEDVKLLSAKVEMACIDLNGRPKRIPKFVMDKILPVLFAEAT
ncbi:MAG: tol-pal system-associated acyl-CoA thioesterase [Robiginitomaculum sp.]|nr:tol-pal system-associated acyl-CoA thioesterase [Robiginitomaculum sp.]